MNLGSQPWVEQGDRIRHSHQDEGAPPGGMHAQIVILGFESQDVPADLRRQSAQQGGRKGSGDRLWLWL
jgi:hypothetical protein